MFAARPVPIACIFLFLLQCLHGRSDAQARAQKHSNKRKEDNTSYTQKKTRHSYITSQQTSEQKSDRLKDSNKETVKQANKESSKHSRKEDNTNIKPADKQTGKYTLLDLIQSNYVLKTTAQPGVCVWSYICILHADVNFINTTE